ncbi:hypothetical protein BGS_0474 [Beggiatoa sp. SS]|nr:hypothetical protein BGS_0474 [Beggiatoa sp. SS]
MAGLETETRSIASLQWKQSLILSTFDKLIAGIIYTEKEYQTAALPLSKIMGTDKCQDWFKEIVLTDYSVSRLNKVHLCQVCMQRLHSQKNIINLSDCKINLERKNPQNKFCTPSGP